MSKTNTNPNPFKESKFKKVAQAATVLCPLMSGRDKMDTREVVKAGDLTITAFDFAPKFDDNGQKIVDPDTGAVDEYAVLVFEEYPDLYYNCGTVMTKVCLAWMEGYDTPEEASADLAAEGGVKVRFSEGKTRGGRNLTNCEFI